MRWSIASVVTGSALAGIGLVAWSWQAACVVCGAALIALGLVRST